MSKIEFLTVVTVKLDGRIVGTIKPKYFSDGSVIWRYWPKGSKTPGMPYFTLESCQNSLKG